MAIKPAELNTYALIDDNRNVLVITATVMDAPPTPPPGPNQVYSQPSGTVWTFEAPIRKATTAPPTTIRTTTTTSGPIWELLTLNSQGVYSNPVRINADGTPYTG